MGSRPVKPRATRMASIVASEPEFTKRHCGSLKAPGEVLGHDDGVLGRQAELGAERRALLDGLDDGGMGVALDHAAVAVVEVGDLLALDAPDVRALAVGEVHRVRVAGVIGGGDAHGHVLDGALVELVRLGRARSRAASLPSP